MALENNHIRIHTLISVIDIDQKTCMSKEIHGNLNKSQKAITLCQDQKITLSLHQH